MDQAGASRPSARGRGGGGGGSTGNTDGAGGAEGAAGVVLGCPEVLWDSGLGTPLVL